MARYYLFSVGETTLIVEIISQDPDGQCLCRIVRRLHIPTRPPRGYYEWLHTQPGQGAHIVLPRELLRPCRLNTKLHRESRRPRAVHPAIYALIAVTAIAVFFLPQIIALIVK